MVTHSKRTDSRHSRTCHIIGLSRHRIGVDGMGVTTLVAFHGCPFNCKYCLNPQALSASAIWRSFTTEELYKTAKQDDLYFRATGGGVTFGGGEPLLSYRQIIHFHQHCVENGKRWHINIETSLNVPEVFVKELEGFVSHWIVDIKDMNPDIYKAYTGGDNAQIIRNLLHLIDRKAKITVRVPLIPAFNTEADVGKSIAILREMGINDIDRFNYVIKHH